MAGVRSLTMLAAAVASFFLSTEAFAVEIHLDLGDVVRAIAEWVQHQPSEQERKDKVPELAAKLALLSGLNSSLAEALLADGPANTTWMYRALGNIRNKNQEIFNIISQMDPKFGANNNALMATLADRMNEKVRLLDKNGAYVDLSQPDVRKSLGELLRSEAATLKGLSDDIVTALQKKT